jgi:hypothetical protein
MFRRILIEDWQRSLTLAAWAIFAFVFLAQSVRAFLLPQEMIRKLENLPLEKDFHE